MFIPAALHGIEASLLASDSLRKLRSAVCRVVWSRRQPLASVGVVLSLLDGPAGCDPAFCVVWFRFRLLRRYIALWPAEVGRVYRLLEVVGNGCPGHGPVHLLLASAAEIGSHWDSHALAWVRPGLPLLSHLAGPIQHFRAAIWASARMLQLEPWFRSWVPSCVFSAGGGRSSVEAWFTTALDIEEVLSGVVQGDVHVFVADVIKSFDTGDRGILDRVLSSLGLPGWFRHAYFEYHSLVRLRFKLSAGMGQPWTRDGGILRVVH